MKALESALQAAVESGLHRDPAFWRRIDGISTVSRDWDLLLASMYAVPKLRRHPQFLDIVLRRRWSEKSRVRDKIPYLSLFEIAKELDDLGYVPESVVTRVSELSRMFPEFRALDLYLRRNGKYAFRMLVTDSDSLKTFLRFVHAYENVHGRPLAST